MAASSSADGCGPMPPAGKPIIDAILPIMPLLRPIIFMTSAICMCILRTRLMSAGVVPEPAAMRRLRLPSRIFGLRRSFGVIEEMIAPICLKFFDALASST